MPFQYTERDAVRFWSKVDVRGPDDCWPYTDRPDAYGYGKFNLGGKIVKAHRLARALAGRPLADGEIARHSCDNRPCCNPNHVLGGSHVQNTRDMLDRGRRIQGRTLRPHRLPRLLALAGERNSHARLTADQVREIRRRWEAGGVSQAALAAEYGVGTSAISRLILRAAWAHVF